MERLELSRVAPHGPQPCAYTSSATSPQIALSNSDNLFSTANCFRLYLLGVGEAAGVVPAGDPVFSVAPVVFAAPSCAGEVDGEAAGEVCGEGDGCCCGSSETDCNTERCPVMAGRESASATNMKRIAAPIVIFAKSVCVPRGPKAVLEMLLEKSAPASALPGCKSTATMSTIHDRTNKMYKRLIN